MEERVEGGSLRLNERAAPIADAMVTDAAALGVVASTLENGARLVVGPICRLTTRRGREIRLTLWLLTLASLGLTTKRARENLRARTAVHRRAPRLSG